MPGALLLSAAFLRALSTGMIAVLLAFHLHTLGAGPVELGAVVGSGLAGVAVATLLAGFGADRFGRRRTLLAVTLLATAGGVALATVHSIWALSVCAFIGMVNGMGRDRGPAAVIEQAVLPSTTTDEGRTRRFAWYNVTLDAGHALGGLMAALPALMARGGMAPESGSRIAILVYAGIVALSGLPYLFLPGGLEVKSAERARVSPETRSRLWRLCLLFSVDSLGGGFIPRTLLTWWFFQRFGLEPIGAGGLFFAAGVMTALSHFGAAWLAKRIGLVNTMVFTHIPASLLLISVTFAPELWVAIVLFLMREGLSSMDVPTRQSYVMAVVKPEERTVASGMTMLARSVGWAVPPVFAGMAMKLLLAAPIYVGAGLKIGYDLLLWRAFRRIKPPEEEGREES